MATQTKEIAVKEFNVNPHVSAAEDYAIDIGEDVEQGRDLIRGIKCLRREISETFTPIKRSMDEAKKKVLEKERKYLDPLKEAESIIRVKISVWDQEQDRIRKEEEA
ncbi:MAG: hypothetical protein U9N38_04950, partial [Thermodesulfobacteriota bacterium]|nr:hypothetical protein [Thermodesulfobacteriota bacterium]